MDRLQETFHRILHGVDMRFHRYMYHRINWNNRLIGLTGPRGVGKTTLILQHIRGRADIGDTLYVTAEDFYFATHRLTDLADRLVKAGGRRLFIDEIHKYRDWSRELKLIYDCYPGLQVVFTGSSVLDIRRGVSDLSRRAVMYHMQGLSFREYLALFCSVDIGVHSLADVVARGVPLPEGFRPLPRFADYLRRGYYPFALEDDFEARLLQVVNQTLETDIPQYADMNVSTGQKLKRLLAIIARSAPFKPNVSSIAAMLGASRNSMADYLRYLEEAGMIAQLHDATGGIRGLGKVDKVYLDNTNLAFVLGRENTNAGNLRETFVLNQLRVDHEVTSSPVADFLTEGLTLEVGGRNKKQKQLQGVPDGFVVKDDIEQGYGNVLPLWQLGLGY